MAKRKFNKKFGGLLAGVVAGVGALAVGGFFLKGRLFKEKPAPYIAEGRRLFEAKEWAGARDQLSKAIALSPPDPTLHFMLGDALNHLTYKEPDDKEAAHIQWEMALGIEAGYIPAHERIIQFWKDDLDLRIRASSRAQAAAKLREVADRMLKFDSSNHLAKTAKGEAIVEAVLDGVQLKDSLQQAQDLLISARSEDADDADIPYSLARSYMWQGQDAGRSNDSNSQAHLYDSAMKVMTDAVVAKPASAYMHYRLGQLYLQLVAAKKVGTEASPEMRNLVSSAVAEVDNARHLAQPNEEHYVDINLYDARLILERPEFVERSTTNPSASPSAVEDAASTNQPGMAERVKAAEAIYREVLKNRPNDPVTTIALAGLIGVLPDRRAEAITLLSGDFVDPNPPPGIKGTLLPVYQNEAALKLLGLKLDQFDFTHDRKEQEQLLSECDPICDKLAGKLPDSPSVLVARGRLELAHHHIVEAAQLLKRALTLMDPNDPLIQRNRYEVMYYLARAFVLAQQTGDAKQLLLEIVKVYDHFVPARVLLARLLVTEHLNDQAKDHIDFLEQLLPGNPALLNDVVRMRIASADGPDKAQVIKKYYDMCPEKTMSQRRDKAATARLAGYTDEAVRLYLAVRAESPGDEDAAANLAGLYLASGHKDQALATVKAALVANPLDEPLLRLRMQLEGDAGTEPQMPPGETTAIADHELDLAEKARDDGDTAAREAHINAAEKARPDYPRTWESVFKLAIDEHNWDRAAVYMDKLAKANADHCNGLLFNISYYMARNDLARAADLAVQLTREKPEFSQSWCRLAQVQQAMGRYQEAIENFKLALNHQVGNLDAHKGLIDSAYAIGDKDAARQYIANARRVLPSSELFHEYELNHELMYGDPQKVIGPRQEACDANPEVARNWLNLAYAYMAAARARTASNDPASAAQYNTKARDILVQARDKFPDDDEVSTTCSRAALAINDFAGGEKVVTDLVNRPSHKGKPTAAMTLSDFYAAAGKTDLAITTLRDYLTHPYVPADHANDVNARLRLASLLTGANRLDDALAVLNQEPNDPTIIQQTVSLLINANRLPEAEQALAAAAAKSPLTPPLLNLKGIAAINGGRLSEARESFDKALALDKDNQVALVQRAQTFLRQPSPDLTSAIADLSRARDLSPADMNVRLTLAECDRRLGKPDDAIRELESALRVFSGSKPVRIYLADLYANLSPPRWSDAQRVLQGAKQVPTLANDTELTHAQARLALQQGDLSGAMDLIQTAMSADPKNLRIVQTYYDILVRSKLYQKLLDQTDQLLADQKNSPKMWWVYQYRALARNKGGNDRVGAMAEYQQALTMTASLNDDVATGQVMRAMAIELGLDAALREATDRAAASDHWVVITGAIETEKGNHRAAIDWLEKVVLADARYAKLSAADQEEAVHLLAMEYGAVSPPNPAGALQMYKRMIARAPGDVSALNNSACVMLDERNEKTYNPSGGLDSATKAYNQMTANGVIDPAVIETYGWAMILNNDVDGGMAKLNDPKLQDMPEAHYHKGRGELMRKNQQGAQEEFDKAFELLMKSQNLGQQVDQDLLSRVTRERQELKGVPGN